MNRPAPSRKQNFLQTLLWAMTIFLAVQMFTSSRQQTPSNRSSDQIYQGMLQHNAALRDQSIVQDSAQHNDFPTFLQAVDQEVKNKRLTEEQARERRLHAALLVADTQIKSGIVREETHRIRTGHTGLIQARSAALGAGLMDKVASTEEAARKSPLWNKPFPVANESDDPASRPSVFG